MEIDSDNLDVNHEEIDYRKNNSNNSNNTIAEEDLAVLETGYSNYSEKRIVSSSNENEDFHDNEYIRYGNNDKFVEIKDWEYNRIEKCRNFINTIDPIFDELSISISEAMQTTRELSLILEQKTKMWNNYSKNLENSVQSGSKNISTVTRSTNFSSFILKSLEYEYNIKNNENKSTYNSLKISNVTRNDNMDSNNIDGGKIRLSNYIFKTISIQKVWPSIFYNYGEQEAYFLKKLSQSIESDVVNGHLCWISKRYYKNAQGYIKGLRLARKEFDTFIINAEQSWNKYEQAVKNSQKLDLDANYCLKAGKLCDSWYFDQIYRHNIFKFVEAQKKFHDILIATIDNLMELEIWRASSIQLTMNYFLLKQNEFYEYIQKLGEIFINLVNNEDNINFEEINDKFDMSTTIPGLRPPPIPITDYKISKNYSILTNCPLIKITSSLVSYSKLPSSCLVIYHGHVEIFKRKIIFGQWQSAYLILTRDKYLYLLNPRDDIEMEELLKYGEKPIWTLCITNNDVKIENNEKRGKRCFSLFLKKQKLFIKKITIRCSNENECFNWMNHLNSIINHGDTNHNKKIDSLEKNTFE